MEWGILVGGGRRIVVDVKVRTSAIVRKKTANIGIQNGQQRWPNYFKEKRN